MFPRANVEGGRVRGPASGRSARNAVFVALFALAGWGAFQSLHMKGFPSVNGDENPVALAENRRLTSTIDVYMKKGKIHA
jgi:hypothetical protein